MGLLGFARRQLQTLHANTTHPPPHAHPSVFFVTYGSYLMSHLSRKCYSTVKTDLLTVGMSPLNLSQMDTTFMGAYALGSFVSGRLGDMLTPSKVLASGLLGSAVCLTLMILEIMSGVISQAPVFGVGVIMVVYFAFGLAQSTGGPVGTAIMGNWFVDEQSLKDRGKIFGLWTTHQVSEVLGRR